ncbi:hypothetical protein [uncultured Gammaproteobacteria bacterium]|nr:hypothetical protein [uncultured Gammaproteobacteria bacterium]
MRIYTKQINFSWVERWRYSGAKNYLGDEGNLRVLDEGF